MAEEHKRPAMKNSFLTVPYKDRNDCSEQIGVCLPIALQTDVNFQYFDANSRGYEGTVYFGIIVLNCDDTNPDNIIAGNVFQYVTLDDGSGDVVFGTTNNMFAEDTMDLIPCGACFCIMMGSFYEGKTYEGMPSTDTFIDWQSQTFCKVCDTCYTSVISYRCNEDSFDFI